VDAIPEFQSNQLHNKLLMEVGRSDQLHESSYKEEPVYQKTAIVAAGSGFGIIAILGTIGFIFKKYIGSSKPLKEKKPVEEDKELLPLDLRKEGKSLV
jgi:hypothetical protein